MVNMGKFLVTVSLFNSLIACAVHGAAQVEAQAADDATGAVTTEAVSGALPEQPAARDTAGPPRIDQRIRAAMQEQIIALRNLRQEQFAREMVLRREDPEAIAIIEQIEAYEAQIQALNTELRARFAWDEDWTRLHENVEQQEAAVNAARRELVESIRERQQQVFDQREATTQP